MGVGVGVRVQARETGGKDEGWGGWGLRRMGGKPGRSVGRSIPPGCSSSSSSDGMAVDVDEDARVRGCERARGREW